MKTVLVMPEYNEERTVTTVLSRALPFVDIIVVVNDGSTDASGDMVREWMRMNGKTHLVTLPRNRGMSGALHAGFHWVNHLMEEGLVGPDDVVVNIDADGQHLPEEIGGAVCYLLENGADVLLARRDLSRYPRYKQVGNLGLSLLASRLAGVRYYDVECGFRLMRARVVPRLLEYFTGLRYGCAQEIAIITARLGFRIDNSYPGPVAYYRPGARFRDGFVNVAMGTLAYVRVKLHIRGHVAISARRLLRGVHIESPGEALEREV